MTKGKKHKIYKSTHKKILPTSAKYNHLAHLAKPIPVTGSDISKITETFDLHLTEASLMLGLNTSSLYDTKKKDKIQPANISILLRIYSALPEYIPQFEHPPIESLIMKIQNIDPDFEQSMIGILLGLERNSSFRLRREGIQHGSQTTKILSSLIHKIITENPKNWFLIKEIIEAESSARKINPPESVWVEGGWNQHIKTDNKRIKKTNKPKNKIILSSSLTPNESSEAGNYEQNQT